MAGVAGRLAYYRNHYKVNSLIEFIIDRRNILNRKPVVKVKDIAKHRYCNVNRKNDKGTEKIRILMTSKGLSFKEQIFYIQLYRMLGSSWGAFNNLSYNINTDIIPLRVKKGNFHKGHFPYQAVTDGAGSFRNFIDNRIYRDIDLFHKTIDGMGNATPYEALIEILNLGIYNIQKPTFSLTQVIADISIIRPDKINPVGFCAFYGSGSIGGLSVLKVSVKKIVEDSLKKKNEIDYLLKTVNAGLNKKINYLELEHVLCEWHKWIRIREGHKTGVPYP